MVGWGDRSEEELEYASSDSRQHWRGRNGQDCAGLLLISEAAWGDDRGGADLCCDAMRCRRAPARVRVSATDTRDGRGRVGEPVSQLNNGITRSPCAVQSETERAGWNKRQLAPGERRTSVEGLSHSTQCSIQRTACKGKGGWGRRERLGRWCRACLVVMVEVKVKMRVRRRVAGQPGRRARVVRGQRVPRASEVDGVVAEEMGWCSLA